MLIAIRSIGVSDDDALRSLHMIRIHHNTANNSATVSAAHTRRTACH